MLGLSTSDFQQASLFFRSKMTTPEHALSSTLSGAVLGFVVVQKVSQY